MDHADWIKGAKAKPAAPQPVPAPQPDPLVTYDWAQSALEAECANVAQAQPGTRNHTLNTAAFNLGQIIAAGHLDEAQTRTRLEQAAYSAGLDLVEARRTIASGLGAGYENPRGPRERTPDAPQSAEQGEVAPESRRIDWEALAADTHVQEWLCEPIIPAGALVSLYSAPKVGKSLLTLELAIAVSQGGPMLGTRCKRVPVLYLDYENTRYDVRSRIRSMGNEHLIGLDQLHYESFPLLPHLDTLAGGLELLRMAQECNAGLVVIDTVSRTISGDENDAKTWHALYRYSLLPLKRAGISVLRLDHTGKDESKGQRGSSAKRGDVDLVWRLKTLVKGESYLLECEDHRIQIRETRLNLSRMADPLLHKVDLRSITDTKMAAILEACDLAGIPHSAGRDQIRKAVAAAGLKASTALLAEVTKYRQNLSVRDRTEDL